MEKQWKIHNKKSLKTKFMREKKRVKTYLD